MYDFVLHIGRMPNQPNVLLEQGVDTFGYGKGATPSGEHLRDVEGKLPTYEREGMVGFAATQKSCVSAIDVEALSKLLIGSGHAVGWNLRTPAHRLTCLCLQNIQVNYTRAKAPMRDALVANFCVSRSRHRPES